MSNKNSNSQEDSSSNNTSTPKPWYKVWWIWVIICIAFIILLIVIGSRGNDSSSNNASSNNDAKTTSKDYHSRMPTEEDNSTDPDNDSIQTKGNSLIYNGYKTKVNKVTYWNGDGDDDTPSKSKQFVIANVTITNNSDSKQDYNPYDYKLSDNGNEVDFDADIMNDKYSDSELNTGSLQPGASVSGNLLGEATPGHKLQLVYTPNEFEDKSGSINLN